MMSLRCPLVDCTAAVDNADNMQHGAKPTSKTVFSMKNGDLRSFAMAAVAAMPSERKFQAAAIAPAVAQRIVISPVRTPRVTRHNPYEPCLEPCALTAEESFVECYSLPATPVTTPGATPVSCQTTSPSSRNGSQKASRQQQGHSARQGAPSVRLQCSPSGASRCAMRTVLSATVDRSSGRPIPRALMQSS